MPHFLDVLRTNHHKWAKLGSLGDMVDATLGDGGYKEVFKKERLVGKLLFGKQRKTLSDMMKRIGDSGCAARCRNSGIALDVLRWVVGRHAAHLLYHSMGVKTGMC